MKSIFVFITTTEVISNFISDKSQSLSFKYFNFRFLEKKYFYLSNQNSITDLSTSVEYEKKNIKIIDKIYKKDHKKYMRKKNLMI